MGVPILRQQNWGNHRPCGGSIHAGYWVELSGQPYFLSRDDDGFGSVGGGFNGTNRPPDAGCSMMESVRAGAGSGSFRAAFSAPPSGKNSRVPARTAGGIEGVAGRSEERRGGKEGGGTVRTR